MLRFTLCTTLCLTLTVVANAQPTAISASDFNGFYWQQFRNNDPGTTFTSTPALGGSFGDAISPFPSTLVVDERDFTPTDNLAFAPNAYRYYFSDTADTNFPESAKFDLQFGDIGFDLSFDMELNFGSIFPRKEAGIRIQGNASDAITFLATSNGPSAEGGAVFVGGSSFIFRNFNDVGIYANDGDILNMRVIYVPPVRDENNPNTVIVPGNYEVRVSENGGAEAIHGPFDFTNTQQGLFGETEFWFAQQWQGDTENANDFATATYSNIVWGNPFAATADIDDDGDVDGTDFLMIQRDDPGLIPQFQTDYGMTGLTVAATGTVPEPGSLATLAIGLSLLGGFCRRRKP